MTGSRIKLKRFLTALGIAVLIPGAILLCVCIIMSLHTDPVISAPVSGKDYSSCGDALHTVTFLNENGDTIKELTVPNGGFISELPSYRDSSYVFLNWDIPLYSNSDILNTPVYENMVVLPVSESQELIYLNSLSVLGMEPSEVDTEALHATITATGEEISHNAH